MHAARNKGQFMEHTTDVHVPIAMGICTPSCGHQLTATPVTLASQFRISRACPVRHSEADHTEIV
jgi:hypothetical protein